MIEKIKEYYKNLKLLIDKVIATDVNGKDIGFHEAVSMASELLIKQASSGNTVMIIGNGASASISSHISTDLWKNAGVKATAFNDASLLTCISNDYGYKYVFEKPIEMSARHGDVLFAISSSGKSENILRGVNMAKSKNCHIVTFSGFNADNPLRSLGEINFYIPAVEYGPVEVIHHAICHSIVDLIIKIKEGK
ncbi:MAG: SIS domain-containing protein [Elusimicrobia bacterium]|nr:SIS domain-containing protein [Candidatus Liberimonas magnetica]